MSLCCRSILPPDTYINTDTTAKIKGVSGKFLDILGRAKIHCILGDVNLEVNVYVAENLADSTFILGRDVVEGNECIIDYRQLTFEICGSRIPLMKAYSGRQLKGAASLHCNKTNIIPAHSSKVIDCHLKNRSKRLYLTMTGAAEVSQKLLDSSNLSSRDALLYANRGKTQLIFHNLGDQPVFIYRNKRLASFTTFHPIEINSLNLAQCSRSDYTTEDKSPKQSLPQKPAFTSFQDTMTHERKRWDDNVHKLHKLLKIDELSHLSTSQHKQVKCLISQFRDIFSEGEEDMVCCEM